MYLDFSKNKRDSRTGSKMNIQVAFTQAGQLDISLEGDNTKTLPPALLVAHIWNMDAWMDKASVALQLYMRDRARDNEDHIGDRVGYKVCDQFAYLHVKIESLMNKVPAIMALDKHMLAEAKAVCDEYKELQAFLQPILWTDLPRSQMDITLE